MVKILMKKAEMDGPDLYIALLDYRNTPLSGMQFSAAQLLMSRNLRTKLPTSSAKLKPTVVKAKQQLGKVKEQQRKFYDRGAMISEAEIWRRGENQARKTVES